MALTWTHRFLIPFRILCFALLCGSVLLGAASATTAAQNTSLEIRVEAGRYDRENSPVSTQIKLATEPASMNVTLTDGDGNSIPGQLSKLSVAQFNELPTETPKTNLYGLQFVLPKLAAGESTEFSMTFNPKAAANSQWEDVGPGQALLKLGGQPAIEYMHEALDTSTEKRRGETYKVFHHVYTPDGSQRMTKGPGGLFPHHRGLFYGFNRISYGDKKADVWHNNDGESQQHEKAVERFAGPIIGRDLNVISWNGQDQQPFAMEQREMTTQRIGPAIVIDFHSKLENVTDQTIKFRGDPQHAGFQFRASQLIPDHTKHLTYYIRPDGPDKPGSFRNWSQKPNETEINRQHVNLPWNAACIALPKLEVVAELVAAAENASQGEGDNKPAPAKLDVEQTNRFTVCYLDSPNNPKESRFSERDYARFGSYFDYDLEPGKFFEVRYRAYILPGEASVEQIQRLSRDFVTPVVATVVQ